MFFSIIIPTFNPGIIIEPLLTSITKNDCVNDIEIIISDDCSTESFDNILNKYNLNFKIISNQKHMGFPRAGRQHGLENAIGTWLCFADQDDYFVDNAFDKLKEFILTKQAKNYIISDFIIQDTYNNITLRETQIKSWTHGKFYEQSYIKKYNIYYDELDYCEDINFSTKISCVNELEDIVPFSLEEPLYVWCRSNNSLSNENYYIHSFSDYISATSGVIIEYIEKYQTNEKLSTMYQIMFIQTILHIYFYLQGVSFYHQKELMLKAILTFTPLYKRFKEVYHYTNEKLVKLLNTDLITFYNRIRYTDFKQLPFFEQVTFEEWLFTYFD